jgi:hypothetical protein
MTLDYADRYYASAYGRFNSPDPYLASEGSSPCREATK